MTFNVGPFTLYRSKKGETLDISLTAFGDAPFGWEYGWEDPLAYRQPWLQIRVMKLMLFSFQIFPQGGFEIWFMGFWWIK